MSIKFACSCGKAYKVPETFSGKRVKCKQCNEPIRVQSQSQTGVVSTRAAAVSKRSVLASERLGDAVPKSKSERTRTSESSRKSGRSSATSGRSSATSARSSATSGRTSSRSASPAKSSRRSSSGTARFKVPDLNEGNKLKIYQKKRDEEFRRGEGRLTYFEDGKPKKAFKLTKEKDVVVGRDGSCPISIPLESLSKEHVKIEYKLGTFILSDLQSTNGVLVNGRVVRRSSLRSGDVIQLGEAVLRLDC